MGENFVTSPSCSCVLHWDFSCLDRGLNLKTLNYWTFPEKILLVWYRPGVTLQLISIFFCFTTMWVEVKERTCSHEVLFFFESRSVPHGVIWCNLRHVVICEKIHVQLNSNFTNWWIAVQWQSPGCGFKSYSRLNLFFHLLYKVAWSTVMIFHCSLSPCKQVDSLSFSLNTESSTARWLTTVAVQPHHRFLFLCNSFVQTSFIIVSRSILIDC